MDEQKWLETFRHRKPRLLGAGSYASFGILLPLIRVDGKPHILFEVRSQDMRRQPGEICFPGGKVDPSDASEKEAAIRETSEELGISMDEVRDVYPLDYIITPFGTMIYPFVGRIETTPEDLQPNPAEVGEVFTVPLDDLLNDEPDIYTIDVKMHPEESFPYDRIPGGKQYEWQARQMQEVFYYHEDKVIWGLTARILHHFLSELKKNQ
ncbi:coenzyme A diphosphatase NUDT7 [Rossellomorea marisflavi]